MPHIGPKKSPYKRHAESWRQCTRCDLCHTRKKVVIADGSIPCDILFIGEAPGFNENGSGKPFIGPAGNLLRSIIDWSGASDYRWAMTNLVGCIPLDEDNAKTKNPPKSSLRECAPRVKEFISLCKPKLIVAVGRLAHRELSAHQERYFDDIPTDVEVVDILHPAAILRAHPASKGLAIQNQVVIITDAIADCL